jgi:hypothetical protein
MRSKPTKKTAKKPAKKVVKKTAKKAVKKMQAPVAPPEPTPTPEPAPTLSPFALADHDPSKAPGKQHRPPPMSLRGVKHSDTTIAKARPHFNRRMNLGR